MALETRPNRDGFWSHFKRVSRSNRPRTGLFRDRTALGPATRRSNGASRGFDEDVDEDDDSPGKNPEHAAVQKVKNAHESAARAVEQQKFNHLASKVKARSLLERKNETNTALALARAVGRRLEALRAPRTP